MARPRTLPTAPTADDTTEPRYLLQITPRSGNTKTGPIPTTMRPMSTCPTDCPFLPTGEIGGCYGTGRIFALADKYSRGMSAADIATVLSRGVARGARFLRDRVVGDVLTESGEIDHDYIATVARAATDAGLIPFGYTHAWRQFTVSDVDRVRATGYVMNASCETGEDVAQSVALGMPAVITGDDWEDGDMVGGRRVVTCPAQTGAAPNCAECGLCARPNRAAVVRFLIHGTARKRAAQSVAARATETCDYCDRPADHDRTTCAMHAFN